jgi:hypothetical protein
LFALAGHAAGGARRALVDRTAKGLRGAPRDALIADETPPEQRGAAYGLRQSLDTVGALLAPLVAAGLMIWLAGDIRRSSGSRSSPPSSRWRSFFCSCASPSGHVAAQAAAAAAKAFARSTGCRRLILVAFLFTLARFSESFLVLKGAEAGLSLPPRRWCWWCSTSPTCCCPIRPGALGDRRDPRRS